MSRLCPQCGREYGDDHEKCPHDGSPTILMNKKNEFIGKTIEGRFTIKSLVGMGGMGAVYRAHQHSMDRDVAVKVLHKDMTTNKEAVKRFFREARAVSRLKSPHTITVFDFGQTNDGLLYLVMELLDGRPLSNFLAKNPGSMAPKKAVDIVDQILSALSEAHGAGILHRDLKPDNIFLLADDETRDFVKVLDFGIAKMIGHEGTSLTGTGKIFGTPTYMSPEQAQGYKLDERSDIYSVGILLFELLAGKPPFEASTPIAMLLRKASEEAPTIYKVNPDVRVPKGLQEALSKLLAIELDHRINNAAEARRMLKYGLASTPVDPVPIPDIVIRRGTSEMKIDKSVTTEDYVDENTGQNIDAPDAVGGHPDQNRRPLLAWMVLGSLVVVVGIVTYALVFSGPTEEPEVQALMKPTFTGEETDHGGVPVSQAADVFIGTDVVDAPVGTAALERDSKNVETSVPTPEEVEETPKVVRTQPEEVRTGADKSAVEKQKKETPRRLIRKRRPKRHQDEQKHKEDTDNLRMLRRNRGGPSEPSGPGDEDEEMLDLLRR